MDDRYQKWRTSNTQKNKNKPTETQTTNHPALERSRTTLLRFVCSRNEEKCVPAAWRSYFLNQKFMTTGHLSHRHTQLITRFRQRHRRPQYDRTLNIGSARYDLPGRPQYTTRRRPQELRRWDGKMTPFSPTTGSPRCRHGAATRSKGCPKNGCFRCVSVCLCECVYINIENNKEGPPVLSPSGAYFYSQSVHQHTKHTQKTKPPDSSHEGRENTSTEQRTQ